MGGKVLSKEDMDKALAGMKDHLLKKNVAQEAANDIVKNVEASLLGQKTATFQSIDAIVRTAVEAAIKRILTPTNSLDLLREIQQQKTRGSRPYVISIVGVNGVGKSTNLSKICFFLLQNKFKVLIAACDTFRSGAVEQLRVHARNLKELSERDGGIVELYEKGYGKDAANIAKDAVEYAESNGFDVVLIDTAGRRHNDVRLMSSLEKFAKFAVPDKILMVGEALVGSDAVMQARNFNAAFGSQRRLDGFIISKCDTVGDMVGLATPPTWLYWLTNVDWNPHQHGLCNRHSGGIFGRWTELPGSADAEHLVGGGPVDGIDYYMRRPGGSGGGEDKHDS